ncbi:MAG: molecular chaperone TorD family protein [Armatimonadota bacterium]|nr:molecular chaperone TorD family protein [Armatimonadota bacterium]
MTASHETPGTTMPSIRAEDLDLYTLFLHLLAKPGPGPTPLVMDERTADILAGVADCLGVDDFAGINAPDSIQEAESTYISLFEVGMPAPPCPLNESPYNRSEPPTRIIHENLLFYRAFGLELKPGNRELPDHISNQLEFLSYLTRLLEQAPDAKSRMPILAAKRDFIERHALAWIPKASNKLAELGDPLFGPIFILLEAHLRRDLDLAGHLFGVPAVQ